MHYIYTQIANHVITFDFQYTFKEKTTLLKSTGNQEQIHTHMISTSSI